MEAFNSRLQSFTKARRVKQSNTKRIVSLKWPHPDHFVATPDTLTEAGFFFNPSWDAQDNVECFFCGKCLDGWEEQDDPFAIHWDKCRDYCSWAVVRCGLSEDVDRKGNFTFKDSSRQPEGRPMEKARLATFRLNDCWPHDRVKGHSASSTKMAKAGFAFTPQTTGDDTGTCLYCRVSLSGWDEDDDPLEEHHKRVKKSDLCCPFFPDAPAPKSRSRTTSLRSTARPKSRAGSRQPKPAASETSASRSDDDSQPTPAPAPSRPGKRSRTTSTASAAKERDASDVLRRSTRSSRAKPPPEVEEDVSSTELRRSALGQSRSKSTGKGKGKGPIEVIEEADEDDAPRAAPPSKQRVKGKENVAHEVKVPRPTRSTKTHRFNDTEEESHQSKHHPPKKGRAILDELEESTPDVDSESDVRPAAKRRNRIVESVSSREDSSEEIKPKKVQAPVKKAKGKAPIDGLEAEDSRLDRTESSLRPVKKVPTKPPAKPRAKREVMEDSKEDWEDEAEKKAEQTAKRVPLTDHGKDKVQSKLENPEASEEEVVALFPAHVKNSGKGKSHKSASVTTSLHDRGQSTTMTTISSSQEPLIPEGKANTANRVSSPSEGDQHDGMDIDSDVGPDPVTPPREANGMTESKSVVDVYGGAVALPAGPLRSPQPRRPEPSTFRREESPATPPPASSSLLSVSSTTSTTKVESHTDAETLVEPPYPLRASDAQLADEERTMTVEQWIRQEIEVQYERLRRDGEMKIRLFKERAEEVRRQIEAL